MTTLNSGRLNIEERTAALDIEDQMDPVAELDCAGNVVSRFVHASKGHVPDYMANGGVYYRIISDHLGSVRLVINKLDNFIAQRSDYDEFGDVLSDTNPGFIPFGFGAAMYEQDTKLLRFGARDYDSYAGRWTAKNPAGFNYGEFNVYAYVENDPVNRVDPTGLITLDGDCCGKDKLIKDQVEIACRFLPNWHDLGPSNHGTSQLQCLKGRCNGDSKVTCENNHKGCDGRLGHASVGLFNTTHLCTGKGHADENQAAQVIIHEWSHECGWGGVDENGTDHGTYKTYEYQLLGGPKGTNEFIP
ncbi:MAG: RHS repeat-associated core domain-containing protein [Nitrospinota bacterium]|nr:RHS repeat-associated core domain-containing protein [Nitrospinota bacterium]